MCQSLADGGKRCPNATRFLKKKSKVKYLIENNKEVPDTLLEEVEVLKVELEDHNQKVAERIQRKKEREELASQRAKRAMERNARIALEETLKAARKNENKEAANRPAQLYLSRSEHQELQGFATESFLKSKEENGTLNNFLDTAAFRKSNKTGSTFTPYDEWKKSNEGGPKEYMKAYGLDIREAGKLTRERIYEGVRGKIEGPIVLTQVGDASITGEYHYEKPKRNVCGRVQTNYGAMDSSTRSEKTDILLTDSGSYRIERIARIFGIKKSDAMRNQALGIDHRIHQPHQSSTAYDARKEMIAEYEKEGGAYRQPGESLSSLYERLIEDDSIFLQ